MAARPRLVYLCSRFPYPLDRGDRIRTYNTIRQFSRRASVTLICFCEGEATAAPLNEILPFCERAEVVPLPPAASRWNVLREIPGRLPFQVAYYRSEVMSRLVDRLRRESFDLVFAHLVRMRPYLDQFAKTRRIIDLSDSLAMAYRRAAGTRPLPGRLVFREEMRRVDRYERESMRRVEESWVAAEPDRQDFLARVPEARVEVVPNGVDTRWGDSGLAGPKETAVLFLGNLNVHHNVDSVDYLVEMIWPLVRARIPEARLHLIGPYGRRVARLRDRPGVHIEGYVEDLRPWLARARLSVAPLRYGAGIQNKVIETMAAGLPAVVTPLVADSIGAEPGREIVVADGARELAGELVRLLRAPDEARSIGSAGRLFVTARFSWDRIGNRLHELLGA